MRLSRNLGALYAAAFLRSASIGLLGVVLAVYLSRTSLALLRRNRRRFSLGLRIVIITLLVLALAGDPKHVPRVWLFRPGPDPLWEFSGPSPARARCSIFMKYKVILVRHNYL